MATKSVENRPPSGAAVPGSGCTGSRACGQREAQRRKPLASMIALHTDDMWQSVRCYPNGPGNRSSRQGTGPSAEGPFLRRGALPHCRGMPDTLAIPRLYHCSGGNPQQLVLAVYYRRARRPASREKITASRPVKSKKIGKSDKHFEFTPGDRPAKVWGRGWEREPPPRRRPPLPPEARALLWDEFWRSDALW